MNIKILSRKEKQAEMELKKAKHLEKGDTIGVISPASPSQKRSEITRAVETLTAMGYNIVMGKNVNKRKGFVAATEEERAADFNEMFARDDIDAVFVTQGGYGSAQIINRLDYDVIRANPKIFTGFSDITSLHLAIQRFAGVVTFHSPGMARFNKKDLTQYTKDYFFRAVADTAPIGEIKIANDTDWLRRIQKGVVEAPVVGGNLTLVCATLGTPYEIDVEGKILFLEEVDSEPWIIDHQLSHLRNAGKLAQCAGVLIAECQNCVPSQHNPGYFCDIDLEDVLDYYLKGLGVPALYGLPMGHTPNMATLPMGVMARLDATSKKFTVLESGVI